MPKFSTHPDCCGLGLQHFSIWCLLLYLVLLMHNFFSVLKCNCCVSKVFNYTQVFYTSRLLYFRSPTF
jgi:hypothetical protein